MPTDQGSKTTDRGYELPETTGGVLPDAPPAGMADYAHMIGACPYSPTGEHSWVLGQFECH